ncbi:MAG: hypothetical protein GF387_01430 [Candidatus Portnoybacteria bacterium]|nr:hypothetical protein [Candidatus Portnoybacteria bacterium]
MKKILPLILLMILTIPLAAQANEIQDGDLIRAEGDIDVYIVKIIGSKKYKRVILTPEVFNSYEHLKWENIKIVDQDQLTQYITSDLVRPINDEEIYKLYPNEDAGTKRWIKTADDFLDLGYSWDQVYLINEFEKELYLTDEPLEATQPPQEPEPQEPERDPITINVPADYPTIQEAIDASIDGDTIKMKAGTYTENVLINKNIHIEGEYTISATIKAEDPDSPAITINNADNFKIKKINVSSANSKAIYCTGNSQGTIQNSRIKDSVYGIYIEGNCKAEILNNLIYNNQNQTNTEGAGILVKNNAEHNITVEIINNTIDDNHHGIWVEDSNIKTLNNIVTNNLGGSNSTGIHHSGEGTADNMYNNVWQNGFNYGGDAKAGNGAMVQNPKYVDATNRNYKLKTGSSEYSPCIDAGYPTYEYYDAELVTSNLPRNDMGAYGGPENLYW